MHHLYHMVPRNLEGSVLYPLNQLRDSHPHLFEQHIAKYKGREHVLEGRIPTLECLWNDVLFFTAVHPSKIRKEFEDLDIPIWRQNRFYEIDPSMIPRNGSTVWLFRTGTDHEEPDVYREFDPNNLEQYSDISQATLDYYRAKHAAGERPLLFYHIPHILYRGSLDISTCRIIEA